MNARVETTDRQQKAKNYHRKRLKIKGLGWNNRFGCVRTAVVYIYNPPILYYSSLFPKKQNTCNL